MSLSNSDALFLALDEETRRKVIARIKSALASESGVLLVTEDAEVIFAILSVEKAATLEAARGPAQGKD